MQTQTSIRELDERLSAYFDGELGASDRAALDAEVAGEPELAEQIADLEFMRSMVVGDLDHQAERVPEARFEQLWDSFEQTLERESRLQEAAEEPPGFWSRLFEWARPMRIPLATAAAASCLLAFVFVKSAGQPSETDEGARVAAESSNTPRDPASDAQPAPPNPSEAPAPESGQIAAAPPPEAQAEMFPQPEPGEAEIRRIEFGGRSGTISQVEGRRGTTTVIWVAEDDVPVDSERSL